MSDDKQDPRFPLGTPQRGEKPPEWVPVPGRPNWWRPRLGGEPVYRDPPPANHRGGLM